jgi:oligopeptide transport system ATP-binding protein
VSLIEVDDLHVWDARETGHVPLVRGVTFEVAPGRIYGIAGESGSGKSLTALAMAGLLPENLRATGRVVVGSLDVLSAKPKAVNRTRAANVGLVSQNPMTSLHPMLSVETQMTEHMRVHLHLNRREARTRAIDLLKSVRVPDPEHALDRHPHQFSGGLRQRIAIAMALACRPRVLIADEPTTALDVTVQAGILHLLARLRDEEGLAVVVISHDFGVLAALVDEIIVYYCGKIVERGAAPEVLAHPRHPYTYQLLDSLPRNRARGEARHPLKAIPGTPAVASDAPSGCSLHPRCRWAEERCARVIPELRTVAPGRELACDVDPLREAVEA